MNKKTRLLILYDWFYPGFRAGGPIQSLTNLAAALISQFEIYVVTGAVDLNADTPYPGITVNQWNDIRLPAANEAIKVFYAGRAALNKKRFEQLLTEIVPAVVYLNGIFSYRFFLLPLLATNKKSERRVIVCPRGMLKKGALSSKSVKKKLYIRYLKIAGLLKNVYWHATTAEEAADITLHFPVNKGVVVAPNIPKAPGSLVAFPGKSKGQLRLVYLSLINEHKNLLLLLQLLQQVKGEVSLDIYGPVIDEVYWKQCETLIKAMPGKAQYRGLVQPADVQTLVSTYHALILLTKGENFGHALFESLSVGRPVITSHFTPWQNLYEKRAGVNADIEDLNDCIHKINQFVMLEQAEYNSFCSGAHVVATSYYRSLNSKERYGALFSPV